jgi:hypothetical protein
MAIEVVTMSRWNALAGFFLAALLSASAWGATAAGSGSGTLNNRETQPEATAGPGTLNYVEGQANIDEETVNNDAIGSVALQPGQTLSTGTGKAEVLLLPGAFLRVGNNSAAKMISEDPANTSAELIKGQATVEVLGMRKSDLSDVLTIRVGDTTARLLKNGLYQFDADRSQVLVYKGEALVQVGDQSLKVKGGHELSANQGGKLQTRGFDKKAFENSDLVQFSGLRSEYLAEANADAARSAYAGRAGWQGGGWYWDPEFWAYTWVPGNDMYTDAFGWGYYSPFWVYDDPFLYAGFFGDFGFDSFGHRHHGHGRLPPSFSRGEFARGERGHTAGQPTAMAHNLGATGGTGGTAFNHSGAAFNHSAPAFNRGGAMGGAFHGGGSHGGGFAGGAHAGGGGGGGGHAGAGGFGGGFGGGGHR